MLPTMFGCIRPLWRGPLHSLAKFPKIQKPLLDVAAFLSNPSDIIFGYPTTFHQHFSVLEELGRGSYGTVHRVLSYTTSSYSSTSSVELAVKIIPKKIIMNIENYLSIHNEVSILKMLGGSLNVVHFYIAYEDDFNIYLLLERCTGGSMQQFHGDEAAVAKVMSQVLLAISECHERNILHGDIKLEHFLFVNKQRNALKLIDFGSSVRIDSDTQHNTLMIGTPLYTAPEVLQQTYSYPSDLWYEIKTLLYYYIQSFLRSCGIMLYKMLLGDYPFLENALLNDSILYSKIDWNESPMWDNISPSAKDLVRYYILQAVPTDDSILCS